MEQLTINSIQIDIVRKDIKNIHLAVYPPTGRVRIAAPIKVNDDTIRLFAISKMAWIKRNQRKFESQDRITPREYKQRESHYFLGKRYLLKIIEEDTKPKVFLRTKTYIDLYVRPGASIRKKHEVITEWYREELKKLIPSIIEKWEKILDVKVNSWLIKSMKTKWGSCSIDKRRILLNLELAKKPEQCLEYIIVHEMIHLIERHHNEKFMYYMDTFLSNWRQLKTQLNNLPISHSNFQKKKNFFDSDG